MTLSTFLAGEGGGRERGGRERGGGGRGASGQGYSRRSGSIMKCL